MKRTIANVAAILFACIIIGLVVIPLVITILISERMGSKAEAQNRALDWVVVWGSDVCDALEAWSGR